MGTSGPIGRDSAVPAVETATMSGWVEVGKRELAALESAAYAAGVPLRVCHAPRQVVLTAKHKHETARHFKAGAFPMWAKRWKES